jgi:hypothetical protein
VWALRIPVRPRPARRKRLATKSASALAARPIFITSDPACDVMRAAGSSCARVIRPGGSLIWTTDSTRKEIVEKNDARAKLAQEQATLTQQSNETRQNLRAIEKKKSADQLRSLKPLWVLPATFHPVWRTLLGSPNDVPSRLENPFGFFRRRSIPFGEPFWVLPATFHPVWRTLLG